MGDEGLDAVKPGAASVFGDPRGKLTLIEAESIPFEVTRSYVLSELPAGVPRAGHACRTQQRFLVGIGGRVTVTVDDGARSDRARLAGGDTLHIGPGVWIEIVAEDDGAAILVFADGPYDPSDYVRDRAALPLVQLSSASVSASQT